MRRKARDLKDTAIESLTLAVEVFNRPVPTARVHASVLMTAHALEMILKAAIYQRRGRIRDRGDDYTYSLDRCIRIARDDLNIIREDEAAIVRAIKQDRDTAAHDTIQMSEELLWTHVRSLVSVFARLLRDEIGEELGEALPAKVLPVTVNPPTDLGLTFDKEIEQIKKLLMPGTRKQAAARSRLKPLLALDASASGRSETPSEHEVNRAQQRIKQGRDWRTVMPGLASLQIGEGPGDHYQEVSLRLSRDPQGVPVRRAQADEESEALIYRELNVFDKYGIKLSDFGRRLGLNREEGLALVHDLGLKQDPECFYIRRTAAGNPEFQGLSHVALERAREALDQGLDVQAAKKRYQQAKGTRRGKGTSSH